MKIQPYHTPSKGMSVRMYCDIRSDFTSFTIISFWYMFTCSADTVPLLLRSQSHTSVALTHPMETCQQTEKQERHCAALHNKKLPTVHCYNHTPT